MLLPLSWMYGMVVNVRNWMYNANVLKQYKFDIPVICVGNITVGGTGKTPHIEYLIDLLSAEYKIGVLSRGYKRKSKGFRVVHTTSLSEEVGDEPLQIKQKYPNVGVFVDKDRKNGIEQILLQEKNDRPDVILLDDGFQHRRVNPSLAVLLTDSNRPMYNDNLLPAGNLREPFRNRHRASIVVVTKNRYDMTPLEFRICETDLDLFPFQKLFFTTFDYGELKPVFVDSESEDLSVSDLQNKDVLAVAGIAEPQPFLNFVAEKSKSIKPVTYPDHHNFKAKDIRDIELAFESINCPTSEKIIVTTEKDATRIRSLAFLDDNLKSRLYYIPIEVAFLRSKDKESFNRKIFKHVRNYQTNS